MTSPPNSTLALLVRSYFRTPFRARVREVTI